MSRQFISLWITTLLIYTAGYILEILVTDSIVFTNRLLTISILITIEVVTIYSRHCFEWGSGIRKRDHRFYH